MTQFNYSFATQLTDSLAQDSLKKAILSNPNRTTQVELYLTLSSSYLNSEQPDSATKYAKIGFELATASGYKQGLAEANLMLGKLKLSSFDPSDEATGYFLKSLELYTELKDKKGMASCYLQLGVQGFSMENYTDAVDYLLLTLNNDPTNKSLVGTAHYLLAICYSELGEFDKSMEMFNLSAKEYGKRGTAYALNVEAFRGKMYSNKGEYQKAIQLHNTMIELYHDVLQPYEFVPTYSFLSTAYLKQKDYKNTIKFALQAYEMSINRGAAYTYLQEAVDNMQVAYHALGNNDSAYFYLRALGVLKDSLASTEVMQRVARMKGAYNLERQQELIQTEQALKDAINKKELEGEILLRNLFVGGFVLVMLFAGLFFNQRNKISKEKKRSDELLLNILPVEIANELKEKGEAQARNYDQVSILFTDFKDFTETSEKMNATNLVSEINHCFKAFDQICEKYGIEKIKTIGDSYMAAGGLNADKENATKNTVLAGIAMTEFITARKIELESKHQLPFEMRVGIHTGPVVTGIVGIKKFQYDIWGDTVNTASRMESAGEVEKVNVSKSTFDLLYDDEELSFKARGKMEVKGKGLVEMYFVEFRIQNSEL